MNCPRKTCPMTERLARWYAAPLEISRNGSMNRRRMQLLAQRALQDK